jgi:hypothetical protein
VVAARHRLEFHRRELLLFRVKVVLIRAGGVCSGAARAARRAHGRLLGHHLMREAISGHQRSSEVIRDGSSGTT